MRTPAGWIDVEPHPARLVVNTDLFASSGSTGLGSCCTQVFDLAGQLIQTECPENAADPGCFGVRVTYADGDAGAYANGC